MNRSLPPTGLLPSAILYLGISVACTQIPLLNYLGYEFSFVVALTGSLISGYLTAGSLQRWLIRNDGASDSDVGREFKRVLLWNISLLTIPLVVMTANALFVKNCSFLEGFGFFLLLPIPSIWFSTSLAFFCVAHYRRPKTTFFSFVVASFAYAAALGYFSPAIYSFNFFYGYFPGLTYDELLEISGTLMVFRGVTLVLGFFLYRAALLILQAGSVGRRTREKGMDLVTSLMRPGNRRTTLFAVLFLSGIFFFRTSIGFESSVSSIRSGLGSSFETPHFTLVYSDSTYSKEEILWLGAEHEFRLMQIGRVLQRPFEGRIVSYLYPDSEVKRRYIGAGTTSIAKPWSGEVHLHAGAVGDVLKHELVHLAAAPVGFPFIRASILPGLTEGLAMAVEWNWGTRTLHEYSAGMIQSGLAPNMESVMGSLGFAQQSSSVSYVLAGSFCRFLIDRYGVRELMELYSSADYEVVYGKSLPDLLKEWTVMLEAIPLDEGIDDVADVFFRAAPIFRKTCARVTARKVSAARREFAARSYAAAAMLYGEAHEESGSTEALGGLLVSNLRLGRTAPLIATRDSIFRLESPARFLPLFLPIADALWLEGKNDEARSLFERILKADLNRSSSEAALVRFHASLDLLSTQFRSYFLSHQPDSVRLPLIDSILSASPDHPLGLYLRGKNLLRLKRFEEAVNNLDRAEVLAIDSKLESARRRARGDALFRLRCFKEARDSYLSVIAIGASPALTEEMMDRGEQCAWYEENGMPDVLLLDPTEEQ